MYLTVDTTTDPFELSDVVDGVTSSISFNNLTQTFTYTFTDTTGNSREGVLEVYRITPTTRTLACNESSTSVSASILCKVNTTNVTGSYSARWYIIHDGTRVVVSTYDVITSLAKELRDVWRGQGPFFVVLVAGTLAALGAYVSGAVGIILFLVGLFAVNFFGFTLLGTGIYGIFVGIGIWIIIKLKR